MMSSPPKRRSNEAVSTASAASRSSDRVAKARRSGPDGRTTEASIHPPPSTSGTTPHPIPTTATCSTADHQVPHGSTDPSSTVVSYAPNSRYPARRRTTARSAPTAYSAHRVRCRPAAARAPAASLCRAPTPAAEAGAPPSSWPRIASGSTSASAENCVRARMAIPRATTATTSRRGDGSDDRPVEGERGPEEGRVRDCLAHHEAREHHPGHHDGEHRDRVRPGSREELPREEIGGHDGARHHHGVEHVGAAEGIGRGERPVQRGEQQRIELVRERDRRVVERGQRRPRLGDGEGELRVLHLVGHHRPVADPPGEPDGQERGGPAPEQEQPGRRGEPRRAQRARHRGEPSEVRGERS